MHSIAEFLDVSFRYSVSDSSVIDNLTLSFSKGDFITIFGTNGSGKSTLAKLMKGLIKPTQGRVFIDGIDTSSKNPEDLYSLASKVGIVFQNPVNQIIASTVEEDIAFGLENIGLSSKEIKIRVDNILDKLNMNDLRRTNPNSLSGGQVQKLAIAGILVMKPDLIILDEASSMLDPISKKRILNLVSFLNKTENITIINITQNIEELLYSHKVIYLDHGSVLLNTDVKSILDNTSLITKLGLPIPMELMNRKIAERYGLNPYLKKCKELNDQYEGKA